MWKPANHVESSRNPGCSRKCQSPAWGPPTLCREPPFRWRTDSSIKTSRWLLRECGKLPVISYLAHENKNHQFKHIGRHPNVLPYAPNTISSIIALEIFSGSVPLVSFRTVTIICNYSGLLVFVFLFQNEVIFSLLFPQQLAKCPGAELDRQ